MAAQPDGNPRDVQTHWWRVSLRARGVAVLAVPMAALFAALFSIYWVEGDVRDADQTVVRAYAMRADLVELRSSLLDAQTAISGYLATGEKRFLTLYDASRQTIDQTLPRSLPPRWAATRRERRRSPRSNDSRPTRCGSWNSCATRVRGHSRSGARWIARRAVMGDLQARVALLSEYQERLFTQARL